MNRAAVIRLYVEELVSAKTIGRAFNVRTGTVLRVLREAGVYTRTQSEAAAIRYARAPLTNPNPPTHGQKGTPTWWSWQSMKQRCLNPRRPAYRWYGARGITICDRWRESFDTFLADMGARPPGTSLDRINNDGNYEPSNCRWATPSEQALNRRGVPRSA